MKKITAFLPLLLCLCLLTGCGCKHEWKDATCETPKTCSLCEETDGEPLGHSWQEATCEAPKTCSGCGLTEGEALGHSWVDATCEVPKTCSNCSMTEGSELGHDWNHAGCTEKLVCLTCDYTSDEFGPHKDIAAILPGANNQNVLLCKCGQSEQLSLEDLTMRLLRGSWTLAAVVKDGNGYQPNPEEIYKESMWMVFPSSDNPWGYRAGTSDLVAEIFSPMDLSGFQLVSVTTPFKGSASAILFTARFESNDNSNPDCTCFLVLGSQNYENADWANIEFSEFSERVMPLLKGTAFSFWFEDMDGYTYIYSYDSQ